MLFISVSELHKSHWTDCIRASRSQFMFLRHLRRIRKTDFETKETGIKCYWFIIMVVCCFYYLSFLFFYFFIINFKFGVWGGGGGSSWVFLCNGVCVFLLLFFKVITACLGFFFNCIFY